MDSKSLIEYGFGLFGKFDIENIQSRHFELNITGVYVFVLDKKFPRLRGITDILYIGQAGARTGRSIYKRMIDYCKAYKSAPQDKRIGDSLRKIKTKVRIGRALRDIVLHNKVLIFYRALPHNQSKKVESSLLKRYSQDHIELPPLNRRQ